MKKVLSYVFVAVFAIVVYNNIVPKVQEKYQEKNTSTEMSVGTDEERIRKTINIFNESYKIGDIETTMNCFTPARKADYKKSLMISSKVINKIVKLLTNGFFDIDISSYKDYVGAETDMVPLRIEIKDIDIVLEKEANVNVEIFENDPKRGRDCILLMKKYKEVWLIDKVYMVQ